jgi:MFS family permease
MLEIAVRHGTAGLLVGLALAGVGLGAFTPANNAAVMSASPPGHTGVVGGMLNMTRGLGTALGVALTGAVFTAVAGVTGANLPQASAAGHGLAAALGVLGVPALITGAALLWRARATEKAPSGRPDPGGNVTNARPAHGYHDRLGDRLPDGEHQPVGRLSHEHVA